MSDRKRFRGNQFMIAKILDCVDQAGDAAVQHERDRFRDNIRHGRERRAAAQDKRMRRAEQRARLAARAQS